MKVIEGNTYKNYYSYDSYEIIDYHIKYKFNDCYCAVLHDVGGYLHNLSQTELVKFMKIFGLEDIFFSELLTTDFIVLEFNTKHEMEEYMFKVYDYDMYVRFYDKGLLYDENLD